MINHVTFRKKDFVAYFTFGFAFAFMNCSNVLVHVTLFRTAVFTNIALE